MLAQRGTWKTALAQPRATFDGHQELVGGEADDFEARIALRRAHLARADSVTEMDRLAIGATAVDSMNPAAANLALATSDVDLAGMEVGQGITVR